MIAYVFMPDHVHLLARGLADSSEFKPFMRVVRQRTAVAYRKLSGESLWQDGYYERVLRQEDDVPSVIDYLLNNPVRAGLSDAPEQYPYSWSIRTGVRGVERT